MKWLFTFWFFLFITKAQACDPNDLTDLVDKKITPPSEVAKVVPEPDPDSTRPNILHPVPMHTESHRTGMKFLEYLKSKGYEEAHIHALGGESMVFVAKTNLGVVVFKVPYKYEQDPLFFNRFEAAVKEEQRVYEKVKNHPGGRFIARMIEFNQGEIPHTRYALMDGLTLSDQLKNSHSVIPMVVVGKQKVPLLISPETPTRDVLRYCRELAQGLQAMHEAGFVHRDVKPGNIGFEVNPDQSFTAKWMDLSFVLDTSTGVSVGIPRDRVVGTPAYMPDRMIRGAKPTFETDLWALGKVYKEMLEATLASSARAEGTAWEKNVRQELERLAKELEEEKLTAQQLVYRLQRLEVMNPR